MFVYYLKSVHTYHEKHLDMANALSQSCMSMVSLVVEGQYLINRAMLHQDNGTTVGQVDNSNPFGLCWLGDELHKARIIDWLERLQFGKENLIFLTLLSVNQHVLKTCDLMNELLQKYKNDLPRECSNSLETAQSALKLVADTETSITQAVTSKISQSSVVTELAKKRRSRSKVINDETVPTVEQKVIK